MAKAAAAERLEKSELQLARRTSTHRFICLCELLTLPVRIIVHSITRIPQAFTMYMIYFVDKGTYLGTDQRNSFSMWVMGLFGFGFECFVRV